MFTALSSTRAHSVRELNGDSAVAPTLAWAPKGLICVLLEVSQPPPLQ